MPILKSKYTSPSKSRITAKVRQKCRFAPAKNRKPYPPAESGKMRKRENVRTECPASDTYYTQRR